MKKLTNVTLFSMFSIFLFGCFEATTNSSPKFTDDFATINNEITKVSNSESVDFVDEITTRGNDTIKREIRIDLVKPKDFPDTGKAREIAQLVSSKLFDKTHIDIFKINEVAQQKGDTITYPNPNVLKSVLIKAKDIN